LRAVFASVPRLRRCAELRRAFWDVARGGFIFVDSRLSDLRCIKARLPGDATIPQKPKKRRTRPVVRVQYGALPYRFTPMAALEILVVTTRQSRRWIVPKGWPIKRLTPSKSAAREAFEEAGVRGKIGARAIGVFRYKKTAGENGADPEYEVKIFPLLVRRQSATWPEYGQRVVQWVDPEKAIALIREPDLKAIVEKFAKRASVVASKVIY
jgi:8-oxo-dGTP pyrophosphatase MutT (NUDIX family)